MNYEFSADQIAALAAEVEIESAKFYRRLSALSQDEEVKGLFSILAEQEDGHRAAFASMAKSYQKEGAIYDYTINIPAILKDNLDKLKRTAFNLQTPLNPVNLIEALKIAVKTEETAVNVYTEIRQTFSERFREILTSIIKVEKHHYEMVQDLRKKLEA